MDRQSWLDGTLYRPDFERDSCGFGLMAQMDDKPSHQLVQTAISSLACLTHRGAVAADGKSGDGCGLLFKKPDVFLRAVAAEAGFTLNAQYAASLVFLNQDVHLAQTARDRLKIEMQAEGLTLAGFREVPVNPEACGEYALANLPVIEQVFVNCPDDVSDAIFQRKLFIARRRAEKSIGPADKAFICPRFHPRSSLIKAW